MSYCRKSELICRSDNRMNMIWHYTPGKQMIFTAFEMQKIFLNNACDFRPHQNARPKLNWRLGECGYLRSGEFC